MMAVTIVYRTMPLSRHAHGGPKKLATTKLPQNVLNRRL